MRELIKDKKILGFLLCIQILTIFTVIDYLYNKKANQHLYDITRLTREYELAKSMQESSLDILNKKMDKAAISNNSNTNEDTDGVDIKDDKALERYIMKFTDLVNRNDFSSIFKLYNKNYIEDFNVTEEQTKDKFKFSPSVSAKVTNVKRDSYVSDRAIVTVRIIDDKKAERIFDFTVFEDGTIADIPLYKEIELNNVTVRDDITYTLKKKFITRLGSIFIINIENNSEYLLDIQDIKGTLGTSTQYDHELINGNIYSYKITPKKNVNLIVKIYNQEKPDDILFTNKKVDGEVETYSIWRKED